MTPISDADMARLYVRSVLLAPGEYVSPCATAQWDGRVLHLQATGVDLDAATAARWPRFAAFLAHAKATMAQTGTLLPDPTLAALEADYGTATAPMAPRFAVLPEAEFKARLNSGCRACELWTEDARGGRGSCASVRCNCAARQIWRADET